MPKILIILSIILLIVACSKEQVNENLSEQEQKEQRIDNYMETLPTLSKPILNNQSASDMRWFYPDNNIASNLPDATEEGSIKLKNNSILKWKLQYSKAELKPSAIGIKIEGETPSINTTSQQEMLAAQFFIGVYDCLKANDLRDCLIDLLDNAIRDCEDYQNCDHCWYLAGC